MSTTEIPDTTDADVTNEQLLERQRGLEARIEMVEREVETLREEVDKLDENTITESAINVLLDDLVGDEEIDFEKHPVLNRFAVQTIDERIADLETTVELLQHDNYEVAE